MAVIEVNHQSLRNLAQAIDAYCDTQDREMAMADSGVKNMLASEWVGLDAMAFGGMWEGVDSGDSTAAKFRDSLENFADALRASASAYQKAQEDIYNLASILPK